MRLILSRDLITLKVYHLSLRVYSASIEFSLPTNSTYKSCRLFSLNKEKKGFALTM